MRLSVSPMKETKLSKYRVRTNTGPDEVVFGTQYNTEHGVLSLVHVRQAEKEQFGMLVKSWAPGTWLDITELTDTDLELCKVGKKIDPPAEAPVPAAVN